MAHNVRINPDSFYVDGVTLPASYWNALDTAQEQSLNGDAGGTWTPSSAIAIGGAGLWLAGPSTLAGGANVTDALGSGARVQHGDSDFIQLKTGHTGRIRFLHTSLSYAIDISGGACFMQYDATIDSMMNRSPAAAIVPGGRIVVPLRVHNGAVFVNVTFWFLIGQSHAGGLPQSQPMFRVYKVDAFGNVTPLLSTGLLATGGWLQMSAATAAAYYSSGSPQNFSYPIDNGVVIDTSQFLYFAEIVDEAGTNALGGNKFTVAVAEMSAIPDLRPQ